jgi:hypothetical protein
LPGESRSGVWAKAKRAATHSESPLCMANVVVAAVVSLFWKLFGRQAQDAASLLSRGTTGESEKGDKQNEKRCYKSDKCFSEELPRRRPKRSEKQI